MNFKTLLGISVIFMGLFACGAKKIDDKNKLGKDSLKPKTDSTVPHAPIIDTSDNIVTDQNIDNIQIDPNASPENVVKTIIKAAKTHKYGLLAKLCNESINMDGDAKDICGIASGKKDDQADFDDYFGKAKIVGKARIKNGIAEIDIETTAEGRSKETIILQVKYDKWYLKGL